MDFDINAVLNFIALHVNDAVAYASYAAAALRWIVPRLQAYSLKTATNADDAAAEAGSIALQLLTMLVEALHKAADAVAINPRAKVVVTPVPVEVVINVDENSPTDESSDGSL